jgi:hypothetical protein
MKKGFISILLAIVVAFGMAMSSADRAEALTLYVPDEGFVVPYVEGNDSTGLDTVIGIVRIPGGSGTLTVYWTFFDEDSYHVTDGDFTLTPGDVYLFSWNAIKGIGLDGQKGYMAFAFSDASTTELAANALRIIGTEVAAFIPVVPANAVVSATAVAGNDIRISGGQIVAVDELGNVIQTDDDVLPRYAIDNFDTEIVAFVVSNNSGYSNYTVDIYNLDEDNTSVNIDLSDELNFIYPLTQVGRPVAYVDGFYHFGATGAGYPDDGICFSLVSNSGPTEIQTLIAIHY